jgi:hypothetical protein
MSFVLHYIKMSSGNVKAAEKFTDLILVQDQTVHGLSYSLLAPVDGLCLHIVISGVKDMIMGQI